MQRSLALLATLCALGTSIAHAQYTPSAGASAPRAKVAREVIDESGQRRVETVEVAVPADRWGNAQGNQYDLAVDGAFEGQTVAVLHFYVGEGFDFSLPKAALAEKGFSTYRWIGGPPSPEELEAGLAKASQLWLISGSTPLLTREHITVIKKFFDAGHGVYIWGDNEPYYADANVLARELLGTEMKGNLPGDQTVGLYPRDDHAGSGRATTGLVANHLLTTGLEQLYEGVTIATVRDNEKVEPLIYGSAGNLVAAYHDQDGKRAILDGGFTRLYLKWDTAGTARYVKNAAAWLVNVERFGTSVVNPSLAVPTEPATPATTVPATAPAKVESRPRLVVSDGGLSSTHAGLALLALCGGLVALLLIPRRLA